ncbi:MAG: hypothetical protein ACRD3R_05220, partial [Terriglobales bacterium]
MMPGFMMLPRARLSVFLAALLLMTSGLAQTQSRAIDSGRSTLTVRVFKAGLFSFAAHNHEIQAPI